MEDPINGETWRVIEIALRSDHDVANPWRGLSIRVTFTGGGQTITRPAFWDGGREWRIRFAPPTVGTWRWRSVCSDTGDAGLHGREGVIEVSAYVGENLNYRCGPPRVSPDRRYFIRRDGTPFLWLGDTHWQMPDKEQLDDNNAPDAAGRSQFEQLLQDRMAKGFTVYQTYLVGHQRHWWLDDACACIDPERFRTVLDPMLDRIADAGLVVALGIGLYATSLRLPQASLVSMAEYVAARYGAHPLVWITAQEVDLPDRNGQPTTDVAAWTAATEAFARVNGAGIPISGHMKAGCRSTLWGREPWHDFFALQNGHTGIPPRSHEESRFYWDHRPRKPFLETEAMYEGVICGPRMATDRDVRVAAWRSLLGGSYGFTYGAAAVWLLKWSPEDRCGENYNPGTWWHEGMNLPGSTQMTHFRRFFDDLAWWRLEPRFDDEAWSVCVDREETAVATEGNRCWVVYAAGPSPVIGELRGLDRDRPYRARWFDPRSGAFVLIPETLRAPEGSWCIPERPSPEDWVLLLQQQP